ncbi:transketolase [Candidatus Gracilibacteria bacterium]|nr:transketolase [Candidatus Gracilibacteria bacterium]
MASFAQTKDISELQKIAHQLRLDVLEMLRLAGSGHIGGPFGMADIFTALYFSFLKTTPENSSNPDRDYCLLSNGHICPIYYAALARAGFFPIEEMQKLRKIDSLLQGHPKLSIPGVENSSGPLGHGLSQAVGIALTLQMDGKKNRVVCCMSDGEHQEGQTWEAVMSANKWNLGNLIAIMDCNRLQIEGTTDEIMPLGNLADKYHTFGWEVREIDGHDFAQILEALSWADTNTKPTMIIAHTTLGKGVSFMENNWAYHDWAGKPGDAEKALTELSV